MKRFRRSCVIPLPALSTSARDRGLTRQSRCPVRVRGQVKSMKTPRSECDFLLRPVGWKSKRGDTEPPREWSPQINKSCPAWLMRAAGQGAMSQNSRLSVPPPPPAALNCLVHRGKSGAGKGGNEANDSRATRPPGGRDNGLTTRRSDASGLLILLLNNKSGQRR